MVEEELIIKRIEEWDSGVIKTLNHLLIDVVEEGASIGFLPPLSEEDAQDYWESIRSPDVLLWGAFYEEALVGSIQLHLCTKQNGQHRAEIAKLMVHPDARRRGIARQLMNVAEQAAREDSRSLIVLDTRENDPSNLLYLSLDYKEAGRIPQYAESADGILDATVIYYKLLNN